MKQNNFIFRKSWLEAVSDMPEQVKAEVCLAIIEYGVYRKLPNLKRRASRAFRLVKEEIDKEAAERDEAERRSEKFRQLAKKRWEGKGDNPSAHADAYADAHADEKPSEKPENPEDSSRAHDNGNQDLIIDDIKLKEEKIERELRERQKEATGFIAYFNRRMLDAKAVIPHQCRYTTRRRDTISARKREFGKAALYQMVEKAVASDFLNGRNNRGWIATLDWLLRPNNFPKVLEGNYDNKNFNNDYGNNQQSTNYDPRRGVEAGYHSPEEYE